MIRRACSGCLFAGMRRIDLTCLIASPIMAGLLMTLGSIRVAIAGILLWNMLAWWPECRLLQLAQWFSPFLRYARLPRSHIMQTHLLRHMSCSHHLKTATLVNPICYSPALAHCDIMSKPKARSLITSSRYGCPVYDIDTMHQQELAAAWREAPRLLLETLRKSVAQSGKACLSFPEGTKHWSTP